MQVLTISDIIHNRYAKDILVLASLECCMLYQVLARKYRPRNFSELVGQEHVAKALTHALEQGRLHHAYLFTGTRGVGKTTIARILAGCLNCDQGMSAHPCGICGTCVEIREGRFADLLEIDAASRTRVEDTRELLDNVPYAPTRGRYKIYLIDEVHMLSTHSFNALLKTLEEPPEHVKFLLATTDPQKLPVTVLSRCLQFSLKPMPEKAIVSHLASVLNQESVVFDTASLHTLAHAAQGSMRDALSLTDQAIAYGSGQLQAEEVAALLGTVDQTLVRQLFERIVDNDAVGALAKVAAMADQSLDLAKALEELLHLLHQISVVQVLAGQAIAEPELIILASKIEPELLQLYYQIALHGRRDLPLAYDQRSGFEMQVLRMLAFRPAPSIAGGTVIRFTPEPAGSKSTIPSVQSTQSIVHSEIQSVAMDAISWYQMIQAMMLDGVVKSVAMHSIPIKTDPAYWELHTNNAASVLDMAEDGLRQALAVHLKYPDLRIRLLEKDLLVDTPQQWLEKEQERLHKVRLEEIRQHPQVAPWIEAFAVQQVRLRTVTTVVLPSGQLH